MTPRWSRTLGNLLYSHSKSAVSRDLYMLPCRRVSRVAAVEAPVASDVSSKSEVNLNKLFRSKPCSIALPADSPLRIEEPIYRGLRHFLLKMMLFYSKQSKSIRQANVIYRRVVSQADKPAIYDAVSRDLYMLPCRRVSRVAAVEAPVASDVSSKSEVNLNKLFRSKPCSIALPADSPLRIEEPIYRGLRHFLLKMMLFYSKQSKSIRQANVIYRRVVSQADKPAIYDVFRLEKTFRTNFSMLVVHMWLCLRRLKAEGKEGIELGQYVYEIYNHDLETRVSKAGVNLLLSKWMRELEKVFYGNIVAFDTAMLPEAKPDDLQNAIWKNVFAEDGSSKLDAAALPAVLAFTRYVRRECVCLSLTDKEAMFSGNFMFTPIDNLKP